MILLLQQPKGSQVCGQTSVAMITGIAVEKIIDLYGHSKKTYFSEHVKNLRKLGYQVDDKFTKVDNRKKYTLPDVCLVRMGKSGRRTGHLIVHYYGKFYDPAYGNVIQSIEELKGLYGNWRIEYYLEVGSRLDRNRKRKAYDDEFRQVAGEKQYKVIISHDIHNKGYKQHITRILTDSELDALSRSDKFTVESLICIE